MNTQTKSIIKGGFFGAIVYAGIMAGFDYFDGEGFRIWRFIINALFFGIFISLMIRYNLKKQEKKENKN